MPSTEERAPFWERLFRCTTRESAESELAGSAGIDLEEARAAWRAHRATTARAEARLAARARDLEGLQSLGRKLAEARTVEDLLDRAAGSLSLLVEADAVAVASALPGYLGVDLHLARALLPADALRLAEAAARGLVRVAPGEAATRELPSFDRFSGPRAEIADEDIVMVPVERRRQEVVRLAIIPRQGAGERVLRIVFGTANHLSVHLDRVLAVAEAEQGRFRAILDSMPHAVILADASFRLVHANASAERLLPRLGDGAGSVVRSAGDLDLVSLSYDVLAGQRDGADGEAKLSDGGILEIAVAPWRDASGRPDGIVLVMLDVSSTRRLRDHVTQSEKLSSLGRMVAGVAHELNNPLTSVIGYAQLLRTIPPGERFTARLETIHKEADRCRRIVHNLLRFARTPVKERRPFSLNEVVDSVAQLLGYSMRSAGCRIVLELESGLPPVVGDVHEIEQALVNLVVNAQQAMSGAEKTGTITLRTSLVEGFVVLEVDDEGPGVPEAVRTKIFDPFFTTKPPGQGTGLGLWLVRETAASHGGSIRVMASAAGGARLRLELPAGIAVPAAVEAEASDVEQEGARVSARILVVDTEAALAGLICDALGEEGHEAVAAADGEDVLRRLSSEPFDLLVSDATLPGLSGDRLAHEVARIRPELLDRILLTTGDWISREPDAVARRLGTGLLRKPFELDELRRAVQWRLKIRPGH